MNEMNNHLTGEWIYTDYEYDLAECIYCSICGYSTWDYEAYKICPNCQSTMINGWRKIDDKWSIYF